MTTLHQRQSGQSESKSGKDRRTFRRHDMEMQSIGIERWDGPRKSGEVLGQIVDLSAGGVRLRTRQGNIKTDHQIRVRLELPTYAGICPFVDTQSGQMQPRKEWVGWMTVARVKQISDNQFEVGGQLLDMEEVDRGMLGLYLSTQPLAA